MNHLSHLGVRAHLLSAALLWLLAGPASAEEVAYLMYVRGSEGPPATPMRVLWDALDERQRAHHHRSRRKVRARAGEARTWAGARIRRQAGKKAPFAVRDPEFTRFVKSVATSMVQALLTASAAPGAWAQPPDAKVEDAALLDHAGASPAGGGRMAARQPISRRKSPDRRRSRI